MKQRLTSGDAAPDFSAPDAFGKKVKFASPHANKHVLLVFLRYAGCPWCNLALHRLSLEYKLLKKNGCEVVVVVESSAANIKKNIYRRHKVKPPFHIIPDPKRDLYHLYGVTPKLPRGLAFMIKNLPSWVKSVRDGFPQTEVDGSLFIVPAFFLIDQKGKVKHADYAANFYNDSTFTPVYEHLTFGV